MAKKARLGPSKAQMLKEHGELYLRKLKGSVSDREITEDSLRLEEAGIRFQEIVEVRQKVLDKYNRDRKTRQGGVASVV